MFVKKVNRAVWSLFSTAFYHLSKSIKETIKRRQLKISKILSPVNLNARVEELIINSHQMQCHQCCIRAYLNLIKNCWPSGSEILGRTADISKARSQEI